MLKFKVIEQRIFKIRSNSLVLYILFQSNKQKMAEMYYPKNTCQMECDGKLTL